MSFHSATKQTPLLKRSKEDLLKDTLTISKIEILHDINFLEQEEGNETSSITPKRTKCPESPGCYTMPSRAVKMYTEKVVLEDVEDHLNLTEKMNTYIEPDILAAYTRKYNNKKQLDPKVNINENSTYNDLFKSANLNEEPTTFVQMDSNDSIHNNSIIGYKSKNSICMKKFVDFSYNTKILDILDQYEENVDSTDFWMEYSTPESLDLLIRSVYDERNKYIKVLTSLDKLLAKSRINFRILQKRKIDELQKKFIEERDIND